VTARRLSSVAELHVLAAPDPYAMQVGDSVIAAWAGDDGAVGWLVPSHRFRGSGHLAVLGEPPDAVSLLVDVLAQTEGTEMVVGSASLPRTAPALLPEHLAMERVNDWEWFATSSLPPVQPHEDRVQWLAEADSEDITALLRAHSGRHDAEPGQEHARGWCGVRDDGGRLVAVGAHTEIWAGVPFLASVATVSEVRGQGLGSAVTGWITRQLLANGYDRVTLGMYSDNDVARRIYQRLGYTCWHEFSSGRLVRR